MKDSRRPSKPGRPSGRDKPDRHDRPTFLQKGLRIVHDDDEVIVVDKPAGLLSATPAGEEHDSVFARVKDHVKTQRAQRGTRVWIIHRLDREASGLMVFAKTERAYDMLKAELQARRTHRLYAAVVEGVIPQDRSSGAIESFLYEDTRGTVHTAETPRSVPAHLRRNESDEELSLARPAVTHYLVIGRSPRRSMLEVKLETGRKHQIRAHLAHLGFPIVGDRRYDHKADPGNRLCLHAIQLGFTHPASGREVRFESPIPPIFFKAAGIRESDLAPAGSSSAVAIHNAPVLKQDASSAAKPAAAARPPANLTDATSVASSWNHVASWYDELLEDRVSDHHEQIILPGTQRLLAIAPGHRVLDVACGQGILCRRLAAAGADVVGVDAAPKLIERASQLGPGTYVAADARRLALLNLGAFDAAACVMAIMNIEPISSVMSGVAKVVKPGGRFVLVLLHPAFRAPGQTAWGWDNPPPSKTAALKAGKPVPKAPPKDAPAPRQFRRVDGYLSSASREIVMNPGAASSGKDPVVTMTYHRPIQTYVNALGHAGFAVDAMEEWPSVRLSQPGPRAAEENRARREIPMFLALRAVRLARD